MEIKNRLSTPTDAMGALYFLPGQYLFKRIEDGGRESAKALSSEQIALAFREFRTDSGWLTRRILRYREEPEGNFVLSFEPAKIRTIFIETKNGEVSELTLALPTLVLLGKGREFYLWAAKGRRVTTKTKLAIAPLPNIGGDLSGKICFGKNEVPEASIGGIDAIWNLIFNTPFNGDHTAEKCRSKPKDVRELLLSLSKKKSKTFPASELIESTTTVEDMWMRVVEKKFFHDF
ncbi:MAG: hypothetical protein ACR2FV_05900 [Ornithinimicrobium sp.]|uniref:hypothetical protein n=1 Tax=Ornithinimicrobium sp. TaxID=1977084 RepID=UPI003D9BBC25